MATVIQPLTEIPVDFASRLSNFNTSAERGTQQLAAGAKRKMSFGVTSFNNSNGPLSAMKYNGQSTPLRQGPTKSEGNVIGPYTVSPNILNITKHLN